MLTTPELVGLLERCLPIIRHDAQMMADITRHSPLPIEAQAVHDSTEYESEKLMREIPDALTALKSGAVVLVPAGEVERLQAVIVEAILSTSDEHTDHLLRDNCPLWDTWNRRAMLRAGEEK